MKIQVPDNSLWQYIERDHIDSDKDWRHEHTEPRHGSLGEILFATPVAEVDSTVSCTTA